MIYTLDQLVKHNKKLYDSYIDLKVVGWKSYSQALDVYTFGFFKSQLQDTNKQVEKLASNLKSMTSTLPGVCK